MKDYYYTKKCLKFKVPKLPKIKVPLRSIYLNIINRIPKL
jgi:hypothetical protein